MKINWGTGILIVIIVFLIGIISFVVFTTSHKVNLVEEDYYPKELVYDSQIEKISNTEALEEKISIYTADSMIVVIFPSIVENKTLDGSILLYRPSDYEEDILYDIELDSNRLQILPTAGLLPGKYIIKIDWSCDGVNYYQEKVIIN